jgi:glycosyltransferase involved in cell wall biosynthesis
MFVSGFTFVRNAVKLDYPILESIQSLLPLVDELVIALGDSEDQTEELIQSIGSDKIRIIHTIWDTDLREGGKVLAIETDKALAAISEKADWAIYLQADECLHEDDYDSIRAAMQQALHHKKVDGLLFKYRHFYGSYDYLGDSRTWYRNEIRIIRAHQGITSWKDAQGFRKNARKLKVKEINACVYHYGWVRPPDKMMAKSLEANRYWHDDQWINERFDADKDFDYSQIDSIALFKGTHPKVMHQRIAARNWSFNRDPSNKRFSLKEACLYYIEKWTGWRIGEYKNYIRLS